MRSYGNGCLMIDDEPNEAYQRIAMSVKSPTDPVDDMKEKKEEWKNEDIENVILVEESRRRAATRDMRMFDFVMDLRQRAVKAAILWLAVSLVIGIPYIGYKTYCLFKSDEPRPSVVTVIHTEDHTAIESPDVVILSGSSKRAVPSLSGYSRLDKARDLWSFN